MEASSPLLRQPLPHLLRPCLEYVWPPVLSPEACSLRLVAYLPEATSWLQLRVTDTRSGTRLLDSTSQLLSIEPGCVLLHMDVGVRPLPSALDLSLSSGPLDQQDALLLAGRLVTGPSERCD
jgi:hypothetical protein